MVLVTAVDDDVEINPYSVVRVLPVNTLWIFANPFDLAFAAHNSPVPGVGIIIECWNPRSMLRVNLLAPVGTLDAAMRRDVKHLLHCAFHNLTPGQQPTSKGYTGPPLGTKSDPRHRFIKEEIKRADFLSAPVSVLLWGQQKTQQSISTAAQEWILNVIKWFRANPAPALSKTTTQVRTLLKSAGPLWRVGEALGVEIAIVPLQGQLWLSCAGKAVDNFRLLSLTVDKQAVTIPEPLYGKGLFLVPLGLPGINRVEAEISDGQQNHKLIIKFGPKRSRSRSLRKRS
jgi:hypothetical protein